MRIIVATLCIFADYYRIISLYVSVTLERIANMLFNLSKADENLREGVFPFPMEESCSL